MNLHREFRYLVEFVLTLGNDHGERSTELKIFVYFLKKFHNENDPITRNFEQTQAI